MYNRRRYKNHRDRYYPRYNEYYDLYSIYNSQIANTNQYLYNSGYMYDVNQTSYTNQISRRPYW